MFLHSPSQNELWQVANHIHCVWTSASDIVIIIVKWDCTLTYSVRKVARNGLFARPCRVSCSTPIVCAVQVVVVAPVIS